MVAGGRGGKEAREMYLIQFPGDEEDEGEMVDDEEGEGSLSVEGEETPNIKEEVRETGFLRGERSRRRKWHGFSAPLCSCISNEKERRRGKNERADTERLSSAAVQPSNRCRDVEHKGEAIDLIFSFQRAR